MIRIGIPDSAEVSTSDMLDAEMVNSIISSVRLARAERFMRATEECGWSSSELENVADGKSDDLEMHLLEELARYRRLVSPDKSATILFKEFVKSSENSNLLRLIKKRLKNNQPPLLTIKKRILLMEAFIYDRLAQLCLEQGPLIGALIAHSRTSERFGAAYMLGGHDAFSDMFGEEPSITQLGGLGKAQKTSNAAIKTAIDTEYIAWRKTRSNEFKNRTDFIRAMVAKHGSKLESSDEETSPRKFSALIRRRTKLIDEKYHFPQLPSGRPQSQT